MDGLYATMPADKLDATIHSRQWLNLNHNFPQEAIQNSVHDVSALALQVTDDHENGKETWLYQRVGNRFVKVMGINQLQRAAGVMLLLHRKVQTDEAIIQNTASLVNQLQVRAQALAEEGDKLNRWDFFLMAIFGKAWVVERIKRKRIKAGESHLDFDDPVL